VVLRIWCWVVGAGLFLLLVVVGLMGLESLGDGKAGDGLTGQGAGERGVVSVMSFNTGELSGHPQPSTEAIVAAIEMEAESVPDVLLLQEIYGEEQAGALARALGREHFVFSFYTGRINGVAILSAYPLENSDTLYFAGSSVGYGAIDADIRVGELVVSVVSSHMDSIYLDEEKRGKVVVDGAVKVSLDAVIDFVKTEFAGESSRSRSVRELIDWLDRRGNFRVIVGGDFNSIPFSRAVRAMEERFKDSLWPSLQYLAGTYRRLSFPMSLRIDYLFYGPGLACNSSRIGGHSAGDHYPVLAEFGVVELEAKE
jgi:endonuclease/exonuclease/phosphatase (EEP) superfamily protein YafD